MYRIVHGSTGGLPDVEAFVEVLNRLDENPTPEVRSLFETDLDLVVARAPGRLDVMGGIADYSGSLVLEMPIRQATLVAVQRVRSPNLRMVSLGADANNRQAAFEMPLSAFEDSGRPIDYDRARAHFQRDPKLHWAAYAAGVFLVLMRERGVAFPGGARILICSDVPEGKGVSSSAAIEVAVMQAVAAAFDIALQPCEMALLCQKVENLVAGAPCGIMDQMTAVCGRQDRLLALLCQPAELQSAVAIPHGAAVWGLDSGLRHSVAGADYGSVRVGVFMGYRIIGDLAGLAVEQDEPNSSVRMADPLWQGYLANITPDDFERKYAEHLPERITGRRFLARYEGTTDRVTRVEPDRTYAVRVPTGHPIYENSRVHAFAELLGRPLTDEALERLGGLMYQSHASYSACGLGSDGTDQLVELVRQAGPARGLYGAKITGGGCGGTVAVLGRRGADEAVNAVADQYEAQTGRKPFVFAGSSPGAIAFGHLKLKNQ